MGRLAALASTTPLPTGPGGSMRHPVSRLRTRTLAVGLALAVSALLPSGSAGAADQYEWAALGDSYTAGGFVGKRATLVHPNARAPAPARKRGPGPPGRPAHGTPPLRDRYLSSARRAHPARGVPGSRRTGPRRLRRPRRRRSTRTLHRAEGPDPTLSRLPFATRRKNRTRSASCSTVLLRPGNGYCGRARAWVCCDRRRRQMSAHPRVRKASRTSSRISQRIRRRRNRCR